MSTSNIKVKKLGFTDFGLISELLKLMKPRVMSLVIFTCAVGLLTSPVTVPLKQAMIGIFLVAIGAGAAAGIAPAAGGRLGVGRSACAPVVHAQYSLCATGIAPLRRRRAGPSVGAAFHTFGARRAGPAGVFKT
mgnify:CR=1 FL=1